MRERDPEADARRVRWLGLIIFMMVLVVVYFVFEMVGKTPKRDSRVVDF